MRELAFSPLASRKLDSVFEFALNASKSSRIAAAAVSGILERIDILKDNPDIGPRLSSRIDKVPARFKETRYLVRGDYIAVYEHSGSTIRILAIYHGREDLFGRVFKEIG
jgi:plasmid stabilization system protein ParE